MPEESKGKDKRPKSIRRKLFRVVAAVAVVLLLAAGGISFYTWRLGAEARMGYKRGSSLNAFFGELAGAVKRKNADAVLAQYAENYASPAEGTWTEKLKWDDERAADDPGRVRIYLWDEGDKRPFSKPDLRPQIESLLGAIDYIDLAKFKIQTIEESNGLESATLKTMLWLRGTQEGGEKVESRAYFRIRLANDDGWKIVSKELLHGVTARGGGKEFADITRAAGIDFNATHNLMLREEEWRPKVFGIMKYAHGGVTTADYDRDGWDDIFFADGQEPRLYRNQHDGTFRDVTVEAGLPDAIAAVSVALLADFDNDGFPELFLGRGTAENRLYRNKGDGTFEDVTASAKGLGGYWVAVASAADYDNDGDLDIYIGRYLDPRKNLPTTLFYTRNGEGNSLLRNDGNLVFTDVTKEAGVREGGLTLGTAWGDCDSDGDLDLYVANDFGRNALFSNNGDGTFADVSKASGTVDISYGMSSCFADIDNDGDLDIYVSNVHSGQRWFGNEVTLRNYFATSFKQGTIREDRAMFDEIFDLVGHDWSMLGDRVTRGNSLFLNDGKGVFTDVTEKTLVNPHGWYWGSVVFDYDNDGFQDIYAVNGWITGKDHEDL